MCIPLALVATMLTLFIYIWVPMGLLANDTKKAEYQEALVEISKRSMFSYFVALTLAN